MPDTGERARAIILIALGRGVPGARALAQMSADDFVEQLDAADPADLRALHTSASSRDCRCRLSEHLVYSLPHITAPQAISMLCHPPGGILEMCMHALPEKCAEDALECMGCVWVS